VHLEGARSGEATSRVLGSLALKLFVVAAMAVAAKSATKAIEKRMFVLMLSARESVWVVRESSKEP